LKRSVEQDQPAKRLTTEDTRRRLQQQVELEVQRTQHALQTLHEQQERERQCRLVYGNFLYALEFAQALEVAPEVADHRTPYQVMVDNDTAYEELHQLQLERRTQQLEQQQQEHLEQQESELESEHREEQLEHLEQHREQERIDIQLEQHFEQQHLEQQHLEQHLEQDEDDTDIEEEEFAPLDRSLQEILHESNVKHLVL
jgi:hypothetical protein